MTDKLSAFMHRLERSGGDLSVLSQDEQAEMCRLVIEKAIAAGCVDEWVELPAPILGKGREN